MVYNLVWYAKNKERTIVSFDRFVEFLCNIERVSTKLDGMKLGELFTLVHPLNIRILFCR